MNDEHEDQYDDDDDDDDDDDEEDYLRNFQPDFSVDPFDVCSKGGGHQFVEVFSDSIKQVLLCMKCGEVSTGYF